MDYGERLLLPLLSLYVVVVFTTCPQSPFTNSNGTISSPGFNTDQSYGGNLVCTYRITVPANRRVILEFKSLSILGTMPDCEGDSLEILVGCSNESIGKFCSCSNLSMPSKIYSLDNCMTLIFTSDESRSAKGFKAEYTSIDNNIKLDPDSECSSTELLKSSEGIFYTPNWPLTYPSSTTCSWTFRPPEEKTVRLFFMSFKMEELFECKATRPPPTGDEIRVKGTNSTGGKVDIIPRICAKPDVLYYTIKQMRAVTIRFSSNFEKQFSGAIAGYASYEKGTLGSSSPGCQFFEPPASASDAEGSSSRVTRKGCYTFHDVDSTWDEAYDACREMMAHLVTMETTDEWNKVKGLLTEKAKETGSYTHYYIGLRRENGVWKWAEAEAPGVTVATDDSRWQKGQPSSDLAEHCAEINSYYLRKYGRFNNVECDFKYQATGNTYPRGYICEDL